MVKAEYIITFASTNYAIKSENLLIKEGISVAVMPLPPQVRAGCGICLRIRKDEIRSAADILVKNEINETKLYIRTENGTIMEYKKPDLNDGAVAPKLNLDSCTSGGCGAKIGAGDVSR